MAKKKQLAVSISAAARGLLGTAVHRPQLT
jgi:hypothetical protein